MKQKHSKYKQGFTLIELLVVIAIIGLLSSIVLVSLNSTKAKARDAQRMSDLHQIKLALELYKNDRGNYPIRNIWDTVPIKTDLSSYINYPNDPLNKGSVWWPIFAAWGPTYNNGYRYWYVSYDGKDFDLVTRLEKDNPNNCKNRRWTVHYGYYTQIPGAVWCSNTLWNDLYADH